MWDYPSWVMDSAIDRLSYSDGGYSMLPPDHSEWRKFLKGKWRTL